MFYATRANKAWMCSGDRRHRPAALGPCSRGRRESLRGWSVCTLALAILTVGARANGIRAVAAEPAPKTDAIPQHSGDSQSRRLNTGDVTERPGTRSTPPQSSLKAEVISIRIDRQRGNARFAVGGFNPAELKAISAANWNADEWAKRIAVYTGSATRPDRLPMLGRWSVDGPSVVFQPRFPLVPGLDYSVEVFPALLTGRDDARPVVARLSLPLPERAPVRVTAVYPTRERLPENQLKFYVHFSAPMSRGQVYDHVHLLDSKGNVVADAFLELPQELWDPAGKRITILIDPGRIKHGLKPREDLGPVFRAGESYMLVIDRNWRDPQGSPLAETFRKPIQAVAADETQPNPANWSIDVPRAGTTDPLQIRFGEPLDQAMLMHVLVVADEQGRPLDGRVEVDREETRWRFRPARPWQSGDHAVLIDKDLEDLAGNSIGRAFEVDSIRPLEDESAPQTVRLPFHVDRAPEAVRGKNRPRGGL